VVARIKPWNVLAPFVAQTVGQQSLAGATRIVDECGVIDITGREDGATRQ